ncbi:MAG: alpha-D-ribose 1-methylphosphonate 5-triphosphate diphosphatase [Roseibium sp.]|uniref:alpha-D-ribose 1-methylphosphonate 5-triphosphate diphosphatase n=1 Tax=Roseibium sp. TaxID=1936156 RepID=UPI001B00B6F4|nr:alpha-D-ribose 1-methylphosphonate 5-triphosphate diphosphatase [Roseibium sp.]MBO6893676.1 alpha-D-ribose 1-methylphosphonate 5-triphosphate diphosphatase [Roseibium sp.]MBO6928171.1 alpha-D-ribose 1-methylphosphonate 5-triphosphate diphosphatase [Roseibium sp.]
MTFADTRQPAGSELSHLKNATLVLADEVVTGHVAVSEGKIVSVDTGTAPQGGDDLEGDYLLPGLVDIHTDHFEKHVFPRAHVRWDPVRAALAHDAQIIGSGITTVFDSLCVGATLKNPERREILAPMIDALEMAQKAGMLKADHLVHLRCEITDAETTRLTQENIAKDIVRMVSVMEHLPGRRQSKNVEAYIDRRMAETGMTRAQVERDTRELLNASDEISETVRPQVVALAHEHGLPLLSHDDTELHHVDEALDDKMTVAEFPCTLEAARKAKSHDMHVVGGAPNVLRGGSQSGNVAVADLMAEDLVDILASDYVPRSMLDCAFKIANDDAFHADLPAAVKMVAKTPAEVAGLLDRGEIVQGRRADLLQVAMHDGHPFVKRAWLAGRRVL